MCRALGGVLMKLCDEADFESLRNLVLLGKEVGFVSERASEAGG